MTTHQSLNPATVAILGAAWNAIAEEMGEAIVWTSISPNIKERRDCSAAVFSARAAVLAQAAHIPVHLGSMADFARHLVEEETLTEGDVYVYNDPYVLHGAHLNDITVAAGAFLGDELIGICATVGHHIDVGGRVPGSEAPDSTEISHDGLRIPPTPLCREWMPLDDVWDIICLNSRAPGIVRADLAAQVAACRVGADRMQQLATKHGASLLREVECAWLDHTEQRFRAACREIGDIAFDFRGSSDDDGRGGEGPTVAGSVTIESGEVEVDLRSCGPMVAGGVNAPVGSTEATIYYALKCAIDPECPSNEGYLRCIRVLTTPGTAVHAVAPASVGHRVSTCHDLADALLTAFAEEGLATGLAGSAGPSVFVLAGRSESGDYFVDYEAFAGGLGASSHGPGLSVAQAHVTNSSNLPVEVLEHEYPLLIRSYRLRAGSGGSGESRGGDGATREIQVLGREHTLTVGLKNALTRPGGVRGGEAGLPARCLVARAATGSVEELKPRSSGIALDKGDTLIIETAGGGGWGAPRRRVDADRDGNSDGAIGGAHARP